MTAPLANLTAEDIGVQDPNTYKFTDPIEAGTTTMLSASDFNTTATGSDIWGTQDTFHYTYSSVTGDFDVAVQIARLDSKNNWTHAGLMARETLDKGSRNITVEVNPDPTTGASANVWEANWRQNTNGDSAGQPGYTAAGPLVYPNVWVRLQRVGDTYTSYKSTDGFNWTKLASVTPTPAYTTTYLGMATLGHNNAVGQSTTCYFRNFGKPLVPVKAKIAWVSFHPADDTPSAAAKTAGFTEAADVGYTKLLATSGHQVTRILTSGTPDTNALNAFDLVIISRSVPSADYQDAAETLAWNGIKAPMMIVNGYIMRNSRLGYTTGATMVDSAGSVKLKVLNPLNKIFWGINTDVNGLMANDYANLAAFTNKNQLGISVNNNPVADSPTILATIGTASDPTFGGLVIAEWQAGSILANGAKDKLGGRRLVFLTGSRENGITSEAAGMFDLTADGSKMFLNAVQYMAAKAGSPDLPAEVFTLPSLQIIPGDGFVTVCWPKTANDYVLEMQEGLGNTWFPVLQLPVATDWGYAVQVPSAGNIFFRLRK
jgi:hypothetical protein